VTIEGDNQKQADFLASALAKVDPARVHDLHMVQSVLALPDHLAVFERGIANRLDFAFAGPQSRRFAELVANGTVKVGAIHTYLELYARMLVDLTPRVALIVADKADRNGNLYTGPNTEDTPTIAEAAAFRGGIVVAQVNEIVDRLPRVDVPGDWVDVVVPSPTPYLIDPLSRAIPPRSGARTVRFEPRRHIPGRRRRQSAIQPRARTGRRAICLRPLRRRHVADRRPG
jgi:malonate decarboxylase alpha subunit